MARGEPCGMHPEAVMKRKLSPCGRLDKHVAVEDHGTGFLMIGCSDLSQACRILDEYVEDISAYRFFTRVLCDEVERGRLHCGVFAATHPGATWYDSDGTIRVRV